MKIKYIVLCLLLALVGCQRDEEMEMAWVKVSNEVIEPRYESVRISSTISSNATIDNVVVILSTTPDFSLTTRYTMEKQPDGKYHAAIANLTHSTTYYVRYQGSNQWSSLQPTTISEFRTTDTPSIAFVTTSQVTDISYYSASIGGNVTDDGGASVTERGICYSTSTNPTTANTKIISGSGLGQFTCKLTDLQNETTYYVRAYAINEKGTAYGEEVSLMTLKAPFENGHEYIDLGLSVKWATMNVGANNPEEYGDYFAWGETEPKEMYDQNTYKWYSSVSSKLTKYCTNSSYGNVDNKTVLEASDDAATANWGGQWRMPTKEERDELYEYCDWEAVERSNGVSGYQITSKINGNSIFLPLAGCKDGDWVNSYYGFYWTSSLRLDDNWNAYDVNFQPGGSVIMNDDSRFNGRSVRPVYGPQSEQTTAPTVVTSAVTQITETTAVAGGNVTSDGGASVTERGVVYSTNPNPVITNLNNTIRPCGSGTGVFTYTMTGLQPNTTYYVRAYATNEVGTAYGEEVSFTTQEQSSTPNNGTENGYAYVDLGLSVKWATMNVGASSPEDYGDYFAWGETTTKGTYNWSTYTLCKGSGSTLTKYNINSSYGTVDNKTQLELSDDAARANWGGAWRMPTDAEMTELREQCTWTWTTQNGVNGYKVTSKKSGYTNNSIFLPAAGCRSGSLLNDAGSFGLYWSSSLNTGDPNLAWYVLFDSGFVDRYHDSRYLGQSVRPVCQ